jgi:hypothetical protein
MSAIANQKFNQLYLQGYQPLQNYPEDCYEGPHQDTTGVWRSCPIQCLLPAGSSLEAHALPQFPILSPYPIIIKEKKGEW